MHKYWATPLLCNGEMTLRTRIESKLRSEFCKHPHFQLHKDDFEIGLSSYLILNV